MTILKPSAALIVLLSFVFYSTSRADNITYNVAPVLLGSGYEIAGGTITTDGTIGLISDTNIVDYNVQITGPFPYVFTPSNPGSSITVLRDVIATESSITIPDHVRGTPGPFALQIRAADALAFPECDDCFLSLEWSNWDQSANNDYSSVDYFVSDFNDFSFFEGGRLLETPTEPIVVATAPAIIVTSFGNNGTLTAVGMMPNSTSTVEWASSIHGPWTNSWDALRSVEVDGGGNINVSVPMFYRVRGVVAPSDP